jgi:sirohydrochlorin ferrochelatase
MTAPALITLAHGSRDLRSAATIKDLTEQVACMRPDLRIETAFLDLAEPSFEQVVDRLVAEGHDEIVVVPLLLSEAYHAKFDVPAVVAAAEVHHPGVRIELTDVLGLEPSVFHVLDRRLREALTRNRVRELDGLVLAGAGSSDPVVNAAIARAARQWGQRHKLPTVAEIALEASRVISVNFRLCFGCIPLCRSGKHWFVSGKLKRAMTKWTKNSARILIKRRKAS